MKTYSVKASEIKQNWYIADADGEVLGRFATKIARILCGKHKTIYTPHLDTGDFVIVVNAGKVVMTGKKPDKKIYYKHTGYPGGLKTTVAHKLMLNKPERVIRHAVKGMLPKGSLGRKMLSKLKIYSGSEHKHHAQQPIELSL